MQLQVKFLIILCIGILIGSMFYYDFNTKNYQKAYYNGLNDGFDMGFISGIQYGNGQIYSKFNLTVPNKTTWYFNKGYSTLRGDYNQSGLNPFYIGDKNVTNK